MDYCELAAGLSDKEISEKLAQSFKKLDYKKEPIIVSLPRNKATCRYLKVPASSPSEIEKIVALQAFKYLPYPAEELITGYEVISIDKDGYSDINLVIVHKEIIERILRLLEGLRPSGIKIVLSSFGLAGFYNYLNGGESQRVMAVDIDPSLSELIITYREKLLFSRSLRIDQTQVGWEKAFIYEINKSLEAYAKEISREKIEKVAVVGRVGTGQEFISLLNKETGFNAEILTDEKNNLAQQLKDSIAASGKSFSSLLGLGLKEIEESLNLLPEERKAKIGQEARRKENLQFMLLLGAILLILGLGVAKNLDNQARYVERLKAELNKISKEVKPVEEIENRLRILEKQSREKPSPLEVLYELNKLVPQEVYLVSLNYEEASEITLRGQTGELNSIFAFVAQLEKSPAFKNFNIKVRYATKKSVLTGEVIEFEIVCLKK